MPADIPEDIWREIVESTVIDPGVYDMPSLKTLASINKISRRITVPILFRSLSFRNKLPRDTYLDDFFLDPVHLIWTYHRVHGLRHAPHLLEHVREFSLEDWGDSSIGTGINGMKVVMYEFLIFLIAIAPRIKHIKVKSSLVTPRLLPLLFSRPHIERVTLSSVYLDATADMPTDITISRRIRHFHYRPQTTVDSGPMDAYLPRLFEQCGQGLQSLHIPCNELPKLASLSTRHALTLRTLGVDFIVPGTLQYIWHFLQFCPELRDLRISSFGTDSPSPNLTPDIIPHLESISVPTGMPPFFTVGRNVKRITILGGADMNRVREIVGCPTVLRQLSVTINLVRYGALIRFIDSLNICTNLVTLRVSSYKFHSKNEMAPKERQELMDALGHLKTLCVFDLRCPVNSGGFTEVVCPLRNPSVRGHMSLETLRNQCVDKNWWVWFPSEGWQRMPDSYHPSYKF